MGSAVKEAAKGAWGISRLHQATMVLLFALSTPAGVIIGWLAVPSDSAQADSTASLGTQGVLSAVAAGILICSALCEFLPELYGLTASLRISMARVQQGAHRRQRLSLRPRRCRTRWRRHRRWPLLQMRVAEQRKGAQRGDLR